VNLRGSTFHNVALHGTMIECVALNDVTIEHSTYDGMKIDGILVTELLRVYREHHGHS
jgi:hypothetical protein